MFTCVETEGDEVYYKGILIRTDLSRVITNNYILPLKASFYVTFLLLCLALMLLSSCSSPTQKVSKQPISEVSQVRDNNEQHYSAADLISQAETADNNYAIKLLIKASEQFLKEGNSEKSLWLAKKISPLAYSSLQKYQLHIIQAQALTALNQSDMAYLELIDADEIVSSPNDVIKHSVAYYKVAGELYTQLAFPILSLDARMHYFALYEFTNEADIESLWQALNQLSHWQLKLLMQQKPPFYEGWKSLLDISHQYGDKPYLLKDKLFAWQKNYSTHPAQYIVMQIVSQEFDLNAVNETPQKIAVLLPLSGKQKLAGKVVQEGILAAYNNSAELELHFIDTETFEMESLSTKLAKENIDYIIGPLLKKNVMAFLAITDITTPTLLLNLPDKQALAPHQSALSMRPEDEAIQAAVTLSQNDQFTAPLVLSHDDGVSLRIAQTFIEYWKKNTQIKPELITFTDKAQMQNQIKTGLDLNHSRQRAKDLQLRLKDKFKYEQRNRRDIDMIYLVGSPTETKLLKPYIDVNISPFAEAIPVFASSRSHSSHLQNEESQDLNGLIFTEMPWLLPSKEQNTRLMQLTNTLWPERSDNLQRLFAMGYDSLSLTRKLPLMKKVNYIRHYGQTGELKLNSDNIITRSLIWGKYSKAKATAIELK